MFCAKEESMSPQEESIEEMEARNKAGAHEYNCETLLGRGALYVGAEFFPHIHAVLIALPPDVTDKLMDQKVSFFAADRRFNGLVLDLPINLHAHPISGSHIDDLHSHLGGKI